MSITPHARAPDEGETYLTYLNAFGLLGHGFDFDELVRPGSRHMPPPMRLWHRLVPTLALAIELRSRMLAVGARGLIVAAAYRPEGGAGDSQHRHNAAIDLDLMPGDEALRGTFAEIAAGLWVEHRELKIGLGTYAPEGSRATGRVHLDTGYRFRCWQGLPNGGGWSKHPAALALAGVA